MVDAGDLHGVVAAAVVAAESVVGDLVPFDDFVGAGGQGLRGEGPDLEDALAGEWDPHGCAGAGDHRVVGHEAGVGFEDLLSDDDGRHVVAGAENESAAAACRWWGLFYDVEPVVEVGDGCGVVIHRAGEVGDRR